MSFWVGSLSEHRLKSNVSLRADFEQVICRTTRDPSRRLENCAVLPIRLLCYRLAMNSNPAKDRSPPILNLLPFYYGWFVVALSFLVNLTAAGIRSAPSVLIHPLEAEFGWSRTEIASAASLNLTLARIVCTCGRLADRSHRRAPRHTR